MSIIFLLATLAGSVCDRRVNKLEKPKEGTILLCFRPLKVKSGLLLLSQGGRCLQKPIHHAVAEVAQNIVVEDTAEAQTGHPLAWWLGEIIPTCRNQS